ncbi:MAG: YigZ family protein, partial [Rikenellaceae bacterium]
LKKEYYDARHHCYAWRMGNRGEATRAVDDGEPSSTAGRPILGQLLSRELTYVLVVVIRYFGGTKLGVSGLIQAYKEAASDALSVAEIVERTIDAEVSIRFEYLLMNSVMAVIKEFSPNILEQHFDNDCTMRLSIRRSEYDPMVSKLEKIIGLQII